MEKKEIYLELSKILDNDVDQILSPAGRLIREYKSLVKKEKEVLELVEQEKDELDSSAQDITEKTEKVDEIDQKIKGLIERFNHKKEAHEKKKKLEENENLETKKSLISELQGLIQNEENIAKAYTKLSAIHKKWGELGNLPHGKGHDLQEQYSKLNEQFYYNINIYKELKNNDLKKNYSLKNQIIFTLTGLLEEQSVKKMDQELQTLQNKWDEIGPTFTKEWEDLRTRYWDIVKAIRKKINAHYEGRRKSITENIQQLETHISSAKEIVIAELDSHKKWQDATEKIQEIQASWKMVRPVPKDRAEELWIEVKKEYDAFFERKKVFYAGQKEKQTSNRSRKEELIKKAEQLQDSKEWKTTIEEFKKLQSQWTRIGNCGKAEHRLWRQFRNASDHFFNQKKNYFDNIGDIEIENLKKKQSIIKNLEQFKPTGEKDKDLEGLETIAQEYFAVGVISKKDSPKVHGDFSKALNKHYKELKIDRLEGERITFKYKMEHFLTMPNSDQMIKKEYEFLKSKMNRLKQDINQYENNLSFLGHSSLAEQLGKEVKQKIEFSTKELEVLKHKMNVAKRYIKQ